MERLREELADLDISEVIRGLLRLKLCVRAWDEEWSVSLFFALYP